MVATGCDIMASTRVEQDVLAALAADPRTSQSTFEVSNDEGTVTITGEVYSLEEMDAVTEIAMTVEGVTKVLNRVSMPEESSGLMQDTVVNTPYF